VRQASEVSQSTANELDAIAHLKAVLLNGSLGPSILRCWLLFGDIYPKGRMGKRIKKVRDGLRNKPALPLRMLTKT